MKTTDWCQRMPWTIVGCSVVLMLTGLSGIARGDELVGQNGCYSRQLVWIALSLPAMFAATWVPYRRLKGLSYGLFATSLVLLVLVHFMPARNGARSWFPLGIINVQPSEFAKLAYIMSLAHYLMYRKNYRRLSGLLVPFLLTLIPVGLILREPDLGTSLVFLPVLFAMLFAAGARPRHLASIALLGVALCPALWMGMTAEQKSRIVSFCTQRDGGPSPVGDGYQLHQAKRMLALGGLWGSEIAGMTLDDPAAYRLPAARTDFVFCLVGERWGLGGGLLTLTCYALLFGRGLMIAAATREPFGRLLAVGVVALLAAQTLINTGMAVGLMPTSGLTLPLMSYGGSSLLATGLALGLLMNVALRPGYEMTPEPFRFANR